ncbi:MAG: hypothetical protein M1815_003512 [Lichina confinis]|nr:MAG: hypothetical protein M1815_003512 [Lichina confinis]
MPIQSTSDVLALLFTKQFLATAIGLTALYLAATAVYRLYFSPIAHFPGPRLAALTFGYEFYYDVIKQGRFTWKIGELHRQYGPIIRINPLELHVYDPDYYEEIYSGPSKRRERWPPQAGIFGNNKSMFGTIDHELHRVRRGALSPFFSKRSVARLEPEIRSFVETLCRRFHQLRESGEPVVVDYCYGALTTDIITEYAWARSYNCLEQPDFAPYWLDIVHEVSYSVHVARLWTWVPGLIKSIPHPIVKILVPGMAPMLEFQKGLRDQILEIMDGKNDGYKTASHPTLYHELLGNDFDRDKVDLVYLVEEGVAIIAAGLVTTAYFLKVVTFHLLDNPRILQTLRAELESAIPDPNAVPPIQTLEQLPYLRAVVLEGFRKSYGVTSRLPRVAPDEHLLYQDWIIPAGTPVSMTSVHMHDNPHIFPEPAEFRPERWLKTSGDDSSHRHEKYLFNFSKGPRACLGMNLAHAEIYLTLATVFRRFELELYQTVRSDAEPAHDYFNPMPRWDSKGVQVIIK